MYKWIERTAWITGSLGLAGVVLIFFLQGVNLSKSAGETKQTRRPEMSFKTTATPFKKKIEQPKLIIEEQKIEPKPDEKPDEVEAIIKEPLREEKKPADLIEKNQQVKPVAKSVVTPPVPEKEGRMFAESELNQLVGKIQAAHIKTPGLTNCVQIRITANNNNTQSVLQVERFLTDRGYIISGREKEDFLKGTGIKVAPRGRCVSVTVGK